MTAPADRPEGVLGALCGLLRQRSRVGRRCGPPAGTSNHEWRQASLGDEDSSLDHLRGTLDQSLASRCGKRQMPQKPKLSRKRLALRSGISWRKMPPANMRLHRLQSVRSLCLIARPRLCPAARLQQDAARSPALATRSKARPLQRAAPPAPEAAKSAEAPPPAAARPRATECHPRARGRRGGAR